MTLAEILRDSDYKLTQFNLVEIHNLESRIEIKTDAKGKESYYVICAIRNKPIKLTPEEVIRQLYLQMLMDELGYPASRIELEYAVSFGREKKRAISLEIFIFLNNVCILEYTI